jgi:hypothetical protein
MNNGNGKGKGKGKGKRRTDHMINQMIWRLKTN